MEDDTSPKTVKFNVGGKAFEVSRSLIDEHGESMLARIVSETWLEDPIKPVFIDRNGDVFSFVLEYLRYGSVILPITIPKEMFLREDMDFYGIIPKDGSINGYLIAQQVADRNEILRGLESEQKELEFKRDVQLLAHFCLNKHLSDKNSFLPPSFQFVVRVKSEHNAEMKRLYDTSLAINSDSKKKDIFQKALMNYGLGFVTQTQGSYRCPRIFFDITLSLI